MKDCKVIRFTSPTYGNIYDRGYLSNGKSFNDGSSMYEYPSIQLQLSTYLNAGWKIDGFSWDNDHENMAFVLTRDR